MPSTRPLQCFRVQLPPHQPQRPHRRPLRQSVAARAAARAASLESLLDAPAGVELPRVVPLAQQCRELRGKLRGELLAGEVPGRGNRAAGWCHGRVRQQAWCRDGASRRVGPALVTCAAAVSAGPAKGWRVMHCCRCSLTCETSSWGAASHCNGLPGADTPNPAPLSPGCLRQAALCGWHRATS
jgi:hypothetical protein